MKGWLKLLVLGAVPILAVTMVADQALAADKGSQLIFQSNSDHVNFISVTNSSDSEAVTVLVQYYNESMEMVVWYLRVLPANANVLVNPYDHMIPGTATEDNEAGENVMDARCPAFVDGLLVRFTLVLVVILLLSLGSKTSSR